MTLLHGTRLRSLRALIFIAFIHQATSFRLLPKQISIPFSTSLSTDDLETFARPDLADTSGVYEHALQILSSAQTSPTCYRIATSDLLESCHSIDGSVHTSEQTAEYLKSVYAARLAACEIEDAGSPLPQQCQSLATVKSNGNRSHSTKQLNGCLQALESRPQWWTSYSNSKQNAVALCKAVRADIEKDELIKLHKQMVETQAETHGHLAKTAKATFQELTTYQAEFDRARKAFQQRLDTELAESTAKARSYLESLTGGIGSALTAFLNRVKNAGDAIESQSSVILSNVEKANTATSNLESNVNKVFIKVIEGASELAHMQTSHWDRNEAAANNLVNSMQSMQDVYAVALVRTMQDMGSQLDSSDRLIAQMYDRQSNIEARMSHLTDSFSSLESSAAALTATQVAQAETQGRLHEQMEVDMAVAKGYMADVTRSALHLQQTVADTAARIQSLTGFAKLFSSVFDWLVALLVILALVAAAFVIRWVWRLTRWGGGVLSILTVLILVKDYTDLFQRLASLSPSIHRAIDVVVADRFLVSSIVLGCTVTLTLIIWALKSNGSIRGNNSRWVLKPTALALFLALFSRRTPTSTTVKVEPS